MPYRGAPPTEPQSAAREGIVEDMVRQFADPYAFLRELVQNGIDAGATRIDVRIDRGAAGTIRTTVADDGSGMTRAIIEGPLLTLFESSKENDDTKIGKYGVGFVSVLAIHPSRVEVTTWGRGESWLLRLFADTSYELVALPPHEGHGTEVTLVNDFADDNKLALHEQRVTAALEGWCRHSRVSISLSSDGWLPPHLINRPFTVPGAVTVDGNVGELRFAVGVGGVGAESPQLAGFYNRGLTLLETTSGEHVRPGIRFKIDSPRLAHTLSRDDVRRDESYEEALATIARIIAGPLTDRLVYALRAAALEAAGEAADQYLSLLAIAASPAFARARAQLEVPLVDLYQGAMVAPLSSLEGNRAVTGAPGLLVADASSPLTQALTAAGRPVVRHSRLAPALARFTKIAIAPAESAAGLLVALKEPDPLTAEIARLAASTERKIGAVVLATFHGAHTSTAFRLVARAREHVLLPHLDSTREGWSASSTLFLNVDHDLVRLARRRAKVDLRIAGQLLFRALLLDGGAISPHDVDRLLASAGRA